MNPNFETQKFKHLRRTHSTILTKKIEYEKQNKANIEASENVKRPVDRHQRTKTEFETLYGTSPSLKKEKLFIARSLRSFDDIMRIRRSKKITADESMKKLHESTNNLTTRVSDCFKKEKMISEELKKDSQLFKHQVSRSIHELTVQPEMMVSKNEKEFLSKIYKNFRPKLYTISKSGVSYRHSTQRKTFSLKNKFNLVL
ncbi:unnamed protein product [Blepharisma stoltei]|uniref:Uncharacterized protein n=1 Tax=Blepharisma stoltei TaxID=1481888 RepID=A0AAU9J514_9CILI|nr:unnamed protein product [Blepharisma stoltei]